MDSGKPKLSYVVKFAPTEADQALLQTVEQVLAAQSYKNFSDLCKQALRRLLSTEAATESVTESGTVAPLPLLAVLEQQLMTLQLQIMQLEQRNSGVATTVEQQLQQLNYRVTQLEQLAQPANSTANSTNTESTVSVEPTESAASPSESASEADPLLTRLAPLLEDF
jgi:TolA-binding protein